MSRRGWTLFAAMSVIWGIPYLLIKVAVGGVPVPVLVLARVGIGAALLLPVAISRRQIGVLRPHWRWLAGVRGASRSSRRGCCCPRPSASCPAR